MSARECDSCTRASTAATIEGAAVHLSLGTSFKETPKVNPPSSWRWRWDAPCAKLRPSAPNRKGQSYVRRTRHKTKSKQGADLTGMRPLRGRAACWSSRVGCGQNNRRTLEVSTWVLRTDRTRSGGGGSKGGLDQRSWAPPR